MSSQQTYVYVNASVDRPDGQGGSDALHALALNERNFTGFTVSPILSLAGNSNQFCYPSDGFAAPVDTVFADNFAGRALHDMVYPADLILGWFLQSTYDGEVRGYFTEEIPTANQKQEAALSALTAPLSAYTRGLGGLRGAIGKVAVPTEFRPGTTTFGNEMHARIAAWFRREYPDVDFEFRIQPGQTGVDVRVLRGDPGFQNAEIKPRNAAQLRNFRRQVARWGYEPGEVQPITYDELGNIYDSF